MKLLLFIASYTLFGLSHATENETLEWFNKKKLAISLGKNCAVAFQLKNEKLRYCAFPFDWCLSTPQSIITCLKSDFENFFQLKNLIPINMTEVTDSLYQITIVHDFPFQRIVDFSFKNLKKHYQVQHPHELIANQYPETHQKLLRRIDRFRSLRQYTGEIYFICCLITQKEALELLSSLRTYFLKENISLIAINSTNDFKIDWHIPGLKNFFKPNITNNMFVKGFFTDIFKNIGLIETSTAIADQNMNIQHELPRQVMYTIAYHRPLRLQKTNHRTKVHAAALRHKHNHSKHRF